MTENSRLFCTLWCETTAASMRWATRNCIKDGCTTDMWRPREDAWWTSAFPEAAVHKDMPSAAWWYVSYAALEQHRVVIILLTSTSHEKLFVPFRRSRWFDPSDTRRSNFLEVGPMCFASTAQIVVVIYLTSTLCLANVKGRICWAAWRIWATFFFFFEGLNLSRCTSGILSFDYNQGPWLVWVQTTPRVPLPLKAKTMFFLSVLNCKWDECERMVAINEHNY